MNWFTDSRKGDAMSRLTVDLNEVEVSVVGSIEVMFKSPLMIFISFGFACAKLGVDFVCNAIPSGKWNCN